MDRYPGGLWVTRERCGGAVATPRGLLLVLLVATLGLGLLAMHQLAEPDQTHTGHTTTGVHIQHQAGTGSSSAVRYAPVPPTSDGSSHTGLHLCVGLVVSALGLITLLLLGHIGVGALVQFPALAGYDRPLPSGRAPPVPRRLSTLCVWRL
ncbi:DUF6153 family protein [Longimycelium tulufanense]|uniref:DUF6153 family protein n=1 Tax=Longimycelium tulufanense TaxID=907463 RepID=UPI00166CAA26|nr:DUF6153 family protein [Longimycelium tulufanense]